MSDTSTSTTPSTSSSSTQAAWTAGQEGLVEKALQKKNTFSEKDWAEAEARQARVVAYIRRHTDLPCVAFAQGFAAEATGRVEGLPHEQGIEPALADLRLERVYQHRPAHVHIEVSGTGAYIPEGAPLFVKVEKLQQQQRTGDDKLIMLVYDKFAESGRVGAKGIALAIPANAFDFSGDFRARYSDPKGYHIASVRGQLMLALPPTTEYRLTPRQFVAHIERSLNRAHYDRLSPEQRSADAEFHAALEADVTRRHELDRSYLDQRAQLTLAGNRVRPLDQREQQQLAKLGALNADAVVREYRAAIGWPERSRDRGLDQGR